MRELVSGGSIELVDGSSVDFYHYTERTIGQSIEAEKLAQEKGGGTFAHVFAIFAVCALDADGKRLYPKPSIPELENKITETELIKAVTAMGGADSPDPKK